MRNLKKDSVVDDHSRWHLLQSDAKSDSEAIRIFHCVDSHLVRHKENREYQPSRADMPVINLQIEEILL